MEVKTCEEYVLLELENATNERDKLKERYDNLVHAHTVLKDSYAELKAKYDALFLKYEALCKTIGDNDE